jgi:hypothetical protein
MLIIIVGRGLEADTVDQSLLGTRSPPVLQFAILVVQLLSAFPLNQTIGVAWANEHQRLLLGILTIRVGMHDRDVKTNFVFHHTTNY